MNFRAGRPLPPEHRSGTSLQPPPGLRGGAARPAQRNSRRRPSGDCHRNGVASHAATELHRGRTPHQVPRYVGLVPGADPPGLRHEPKCPRVHRRARGRPAAATQGLPAAHAQARIGDESGTCLPGGTVRSGPPIQYRRRHCHRSTVTPMRDTTTAALGACGVFGRHRYAFRAGWSGCRWSLPALSRRHGFDGCRRSGRRWSRRRDRGVRVAPATTTLGSPATAPRVYQDIRGPRHRCTSRRGVRHPEGGTRPPSVVRTTSTSRHHWTQGTQHPTCDDRSPHPEGATTSLAPTWWNETCSPSSTVWVGKSSPTLAQCRAPVQAPSAAVTLKATPDSAWVKNP